MRFVTPALQRKPRLQITHCIKGMTPFSRTKSLVKAKPSRYSGLSRGAHLYSDIRSHVQKKGKGVGHMESRDQIKKKMKRKKKAKKLYGWYVINLHLGRTSFRL